MVRCTNMPPVATNSLIIIFQTLLISIVRSLTTDHFVFGRFKNCHKSFKTQNINYSISDIWCIFVLVAGNIYK